MWQNELQEWQEDGSSIHEQNFYEDANSGPLLHSEGGPVSAAKFGASGYETEASSFHDESPFQIPAVESLLETGGKAEAPCKCGCKGQASTMVEGESYEAAGESLLAEYESSFESFEDEQSSKQDCTVDCLDEPPKGTVRPKGPREGAVDDRTQGDPHVNLALQLYAYDINAYHPIKAKHAAALGRISEFISDRLIATTQDIAVTITGLASRTGSGEYNLDLSCKRAKCVAQNLRDSFKSGAGAARVRMNIAGEGFTRSECRGKECELDEWRAVLVQVHAPGDPPVPIPPVDPGWDKYALRCCSFQTKVGASAALSELLEKGLPGVPSELKNKILQGLKTQIGQLLKFLEKRSSGLKLASQAISELLKLFPAEFIIETGVFQLKERDRGSAGKLLTLCYNGYGLRLAIPNDLDAILDLAFAGALKSLPDSVKKLIKEGIKSALPDSVKRRTKPIESSTPGPFRNFDLRHPRRIGVFEGVIEAGEGVWMPGKVNVEFDAPSWHIPDPNRRPQIVPTGDSPSNSGMPIIVGDESGLEFFSITAGNLLPGKCSCALPVTNSRRMVARSPVRRSLHEAEAREAEGEAWLAKDESSMEESEFEESEAESVFEQQFESEMQGDKEHDGEREWSLGSGASEGQFSRSTRHSGRSTSEQTPQAEQGPPSLVLYQWLHSTALRHALASSLLGNAKQSTVRVNGSVVPVPDYLRMLGRLCHQVADQADVS